MKKMKVYIKIIDSNGKIIFHGMVSELPLKEEYIILKSLELYNEKEPCIIYRTHIMKKFYLELYDFLSNLEGNIAQFADIQGFFKEVDIDADPFELYFEK